MASKSEKYVCTLSPEMLEKAKKELNEDPSTRLIEIQTLRERVQKVPGLKCRTDDAFLLRFLRAKKFDQERAYAQLLIYYRMQKENPDVFENLTPKKVRYLLEAGVTGVLKDRAPDGCRVVIYRPGCWDPDKGPLADVIANNFLSMRKLIEEEETQVCGIYMIADLKNLGWHQAKNISPFFAKRVSALFQEAFPCRFKGMHFVNEPTFFDVVFAIVKQFMKEKFLNRVNMYGDIEADPEKMKKLHERFPPEMLPEDFGGKLPKYSNKEWADKMLACEAQFAEENKFGMLDMTIPAKPKNTMDATESLGGTFKKLNVD